MLRWLPVLIQVCLLVYCLVDSLQATPSQVRNLPRWAWIVLMVIFPIAGCIAWLIAGRPKAEAIASAKRGPLGPDDDPEFLRRLGEDRRRFETRDPDASPPEVPNRGDGDPGEPPLDDNTPR